MVTARGVVTDGARRGALVGLVTGLGSFALVAAPVVLAWLLDPLATGSAWPAVGTGAALWLLVSGAALSAGDTVLSLVPLLGLALLVVVARLGVREAMVDVSTDGEHWRGLLPRPLAAALGGWWGGYAVVVASAVALSVAGPFRVGVLSLVVPLLVVPARRPGPRAASRRARRPRRPRAAPRRWRGCRMPSGAGSSRASSVRRCCSASASCSSSAPSPSGGPASRRSPPRSARPASARRSSSSRRSSRSATSPPGPCRSSQARASGSSRGAR